MQLSKFSPHAAIKENQNIERPIQYKTLLGVVTITRWGIKDLISSKSSNCVLALYDPTHNTIVSADASSYGLGTVLKWIVWKTMAYISRSMMPTKQ